jgi:exopolysaccharide biosynthesis polyprenyl glycosylphosphotransferase
LAWLLSCFLVGFGRLLMRRLAYLLRRTGYFVAPALIIGVNEEAQIMAEKLRSRVASGFELLGFVDPAGIDGGSDDANSSAVQPVGQHGNSLFGLPIFGSTRKLKEVVQNYGINEVIIARSALHSEQLVEISEQLSGMHNVQMRLSSGLYEVFTTHMHVDTHGSVPLMTINRLRLNSLEAALKTMLDYSLILLSLPFIAPLFALVALLVKLDSSGPVFHRRRVMGVGGRQFDAFKFRTMFVDGDKILEQYPELKQELAANHKLKWDPRITRIGKFLRRTSLDELPQLLNVLRGEMSLVGPRMISPAEQELYGRMKNNLLTVKPGLTGLWQVSGRSDLSYDERVRLDMLYVRNYSIWLDVQILFFQTLPAVLKGSGAY